VSEVPLRLVFERRGARLTVPVRDLLDAELRETVAGEANAWVKGLRDVRVEGTPLRDRFCYRGDSLWWFTELFLHKEARILRWLEIVRAVERGLDQHGPERVSAEGGTLEDRYVAAVVIASRTGNARVTGVPTAWFSRLRDQARARFYTWSALVSRARRREAGDGATPGIPVAFVHSAFWRRGSPIAPEGEEGYIGPVIEALQSSPGSPGVTLVGVGPRLNFRARTWWHGVRAPALDAGLPLAPIEGFADAEAIRPSLELWRRCPGHEACLRRSPEVREGARLGGHDLWPLVAGELSKVVWLQWPWSARAMDEAGAVMDRLGPPVVLTYAEAGGWGRAIMLEARRRGIPSAGLQHGFIYRHWLNYLHEPDEMAPSERNPTDAGFPRPTLTLLFDRYAESHLRTAGHFPPESLTVTGSPRLDDLVFRASRLTEADHAETRRQLGATQGDAVVLVVTKYTQIRHVFRRVAEASARIPGVRLVVKCHPAETPEPYARDATGLPHVVIAPGAVDLARLLAVSRALVTVNSTVAIDALVLGVPSLVVDLPNNLSPFVESGVMAGVLTPTGIDQVLQALVADTPTRARLLAGRQPFLERYRIAADGGAAQRAAAAIVHLASSGGAPPYAVRRTPYA
jgi:hypothetical protein